jgi:hypothetical protein
VAGGEVMTSDLGVYRTTKVLLDRYGDGASLHAASRADELLDQGRHGRPRRVAARPRGRA